MNFEDETELDIPPVRRDVPWIDKAENLAHGRYEVRSAVFVMGTQNWIVETNYFKMSVSYVKQQNAWKAIDEAIAGHKPIYIKIGMNSGAVSVGDEKSPWDVRFTEKSEVYSTGMRYGDFLDASTTNPTSNGAVIPRKTARDPSIPW